MPVILVIPNNVILISRILIFFTFGIVLVTFLIVPSFQSFLFSGSGSLVPLIPRVSSFFLSVIGACEFSIERPQ